MKILIVEDDPISKRLLEAFLIEWGYDIQVAGDGRSAWEVLQNPEAPSIVISDWMMPDMNGVELCKKIRGMNRADYTYFILLTSKGTKEDIVEGLQSGADDFITKPFDRDELKYRVRIGERIISLEQRILQLAKTDPLTGLLNRRAFMDRMAQETQRARRENAPLSLILADIDYFKKINDTYGHQAGDRVLQRFAEQLQEISRPYDLIARYGGEEFILCFPGAGNVDSGAIAERLRKGVAEMEVTLPGNARSVQITASFGAASFAPESDEDVDSVIKRADDALYRAKNNGRNCVCVC
ncbi:MAG: diguanylate cyclase [Pseudomonadota bacterium]